MKNNALPLPQRIDEDDEQPELYEHYAFVADKGQAPLRIDKFICNRVPNTSRNRVQAAIRAGNILVEGKEVKPNYKIKPAQEVKVLLPQPPINDELLPENIPLDIVWEDDTFLLVNKPAGMVVHPGTGHRTGTLVNALVYHFDHLPQRDELHRPGLVHRIDKDTSGLLCIAKEEYALSHLARQFFEKTAERMYLALVWGTLEQDEGTVDEYLARSPQDRRIMHVPRNKEDGKHAITHYKVLERFSYTTYIACTLETGRTHQIRAHMRYIGHPLFADAQYGGAQLVAGPQFSKYKSFVDNAFAICPRQALHAHTLGVTHPKTAERIRYEQPLPEDMEGVLDKWRRYGGV